MVKNAKSMRTALSLGLAGAISATLSLVACTAVDPIEDLEIRAVDTPVLRLIECFQSAGGPNILPAAIGDDGFQYFELAGEESFDPELAQAILANQCLDAVEDMALRSGVGLEPYIDYFLGLFIDASQEATRWPEGLKTPSEPCLLAKREANYDFSVVSEDQFDYFVEREGFEWGDEPYNRFVGAPAAEVKKKSENGRDYAQISKNGELLLLEPVLEGSTCHKDFRLDLSFRATPYLEDGKYSDGCRTLVNTNGSRRDELGLSIFLCQGSDEWPETFLTIWTSNGMQGPGGVEGYQRIYDQINEFGWNDISIQYRFGLNKPRVEVTINDSLYNILLVERDRANPESIRRYLTSEDFGVWFGGHPDDDYLDHPADLVLDIDYLKLTFGSREQDSTELAATLGQLRESTNSTKQRELSTRFLAGFNYQWDEILGPAVLQFVADAEKLKPLFTLRTVSGQNDMSSITRLRFILKQWILDDLSALETGALKFQEADSFPGAVSAQAIRGVARVEVNGTYKTDPNFFMGSQDSVLRPTGRYLAPGELATLTIPESAVGKGLVARVGIHYADLERTYYQFNRFPRISRTFELNSSEVILDNPLGGALYIEVEDGTNLGILEIEIDGAIEMPSYSRKGLLGSNADLKRFQEGIRTAKVPWFEIIGESFALTYPIGMSHNYVDPRPLLDIWESALDDINIMAGRPLDRFREEWIAMDSQPITNEVPWPVANPSFGFFTELSDFDADGSANSVYDRIEAEGFWSPRHLLNVDENFLKNSSVRSFWHEWGHMQNLPTAGYEAGICQEVESNVHLLASVVYNKTLGLSIDKALRYSGFQDYDLTRAALDTMFSPSWQEDERMCFDEWDNEMRYQTRSWARLVEIAGLYGWEAVGEIHKVFYDLGTSEMDDQDTILFGSKALNRNLAPIFEFWGVPAEPSTLTALADLPPATEFIARLEGYRQNIPRNRADYDKVIARLRGTTGSVPRWDYYQDNYDPELAKLFTAKVDRILDSIE
ncbi:MAG: hypothetical protein HOH85_05025 [Micrococcales bacterium]|jgi:hypothetical protein|nr:hypothetical protein [Micrococcales bacterium]